MSLHDPPCPHCGWPHRMLDNRRRTQVDRRDKNTMCRTYQPIRPSRRSPPRSKPDGSVSKRILDRVTPTPDILQFTNSSQAAACSQCARAVTEEEGGQSRLLRNSERHLLTPAPPRSLRLYRLSFHRSLHRLNVGAGDIDGCLAGGRVHAELYHCFFHPAGRDHVDANGPGRLERRHAREALETCIHQRDCAASDHRIFCQHAACHRDQARMRLTCPISLLLTLKRKSSSVSLSSGANLASPAHETTPSRSLTSAKNRRIDWGSEMSILGASFREARRTSCLFASSAAVTVAPTVPAAPTTTIFILRPHFGS